MPLRQAYAPIRPEFDNFLFAAVGEEVNGIPLSMISMLTQLGFDPWREAAHLASLARREATEKLAQIIARLTGTRWPDDERAEIAGELIELLPKRATKPDGATARQPGSVKPGYLKNVLPGRAKLWLIGLIFGAAVLVSVIAQQGMPFSGHQRAEPSSTIEAPRN